MATHISTACAVQHEYTISASLIKPGKNVIAISLGKTG
jgi:hypothetical protein